MFHHSCDPLGAFGGALIKSPLGPPFGKGGMAVGYFMPPATPTNTALLHHSFWQFQRRLSSLWSSEVFAFEEMEI
jgi:hypothetical protein